MGLEAKRRIEPQLYGGQWLQTLFSKWPKTSRFGNKLYFSNSEMGLAFFEISSKLRLQTLFCDYSSCVCPTAIKDTTLN